MEILKHGNNANDHSRITDAQIKFVVRGFVQVWMKFEDTLAKELSDSSGAEKPAERDSRLNAAHQTLFRVGSLLSQSSMSMGELSAALSVPLSTATRVVDLLVEEGYVHRVSDPDDRRIVRVEFTDHGQAVYEVMDKHITERVRAIAGHLTKTELATLLELLDKVAFAVKEISK